MNPIFKRGNGIFQETYKDVKAFWFQARIADVNDFRGNELDHSKLKENYEYMQMW